MLIRALAKLPFLHLQYRATFHLSSGARLTYWYKDLTVKFGKNPDDTTLQKWSFKTATPVNRVIDLSMNDVIAVTQDGIRLGFGPKSA